MSTKKQNFGIRFVVREFVESIYRR